MLQEIAILFIDVAMIYIEHLIVHYHTYCTNTAASEGSGGASCGLTVKGKVKLVRHIPQTVQQY